MHRIHKSYIIYLCITMFYLLFILLFCHVWLISQNIQTCYIVSFGSDASAYQIANKTKLSHDTPAVASSRQQITLNRMLKLSN